MNQEAIGTPPVSGDLKFQVLAAELRRAILAGDWPAGSKLPTEKALAAEHEFSLTTVRRALELLANQGMIVRRQGAGTFVAEHVDDSRGNDVTIGVLVPDTSLYYPKVLAGVESAVSAASARMQLSCYHYNPREEDADIETLLSSGVDGLLLVPTLLALPDPQARARHLMSMSIPVVFMERRLLDAGPEDDSEFVCTDHLGGAFDAVTHLAELGHERIGLVCRSPNPTGEWVIRGYHAAVERMSLPRGIEYKLPHSDWSPDRADDALGQLVEHDATAALVFGDREAIWLEGAARRAGLSIPQDLALVTYDDEIADVAEVPLTAASPPKFLLGQLAVEVLFRRLAHGPASPRHKILLRPRIVVRASCGASDRTGRTE